MAHDAVPYLIEVAVVPTSRGDQDKLGVALAKLSAQDPSLRVETDKESGLTVLRGLSELHLDRAIDALKVTYRLDVNVGAPQVAFHERITKRAKVDYTHKEQTGATGRFAAVSIVVEPNEPGKGNEFESRIAGSAVPKEYVPGVEKGIESVLSAGVVAGFPVADVKVTLVDGKYHDVDSSALAFEIAARAALREALQMAGSVLFEPIMQVEVVTPEALVRSVIDDLKLRRGQIGSEETHGDATTVSALVPLMNMFGYVNTLRSVSLGRGTFAMRFSHSAAMLSPDDDPPFGSAIGMRA
jgi:elongation factor G